MAKGNQQQCRIANDGNCSVDYFFDLANDHHAALRKPRLMHATYCALKRGVFMFLLIIYTPDEHSANVSLLLCPPRSLKIKMQ